MSEPGSRRGRTHDAEGARQAILNAAEQVFAEHGFDGARVDAIAAAAGYNKSLIFQYFGDKLRLYGEVIRRADIDTRDLQLHAMELMSTETDPVKPARFKALLREFMNELFDYFVNNPRLTRIFQWEMAEGWQTYIRVLPEVGQDDMAEYGPLLYKLQKDGLLRPEVDPVVQIINAEFLIMQYLACVPLYPVLVPGREAPSPEMIAAERAFIIDTIIRGLVPDQPTPPPGGD